MDEGLPEPKDSILWTDAFLGNPEGEVTSGPFHSWVASHELSSIPGMKKLYRSVGSSPYGALLEEADWEFAISRSSYGDLTYCIDPTFELAHGVVHMFVGGYMADSKLYQDFSWTTYTL